MTTEDVLHSNVSGTPETNVSPMAICNSESPMVKTRRRLDNPQPWLMGEVIRKTGRLPGDCRARIFLTWQSIGDARMQQHGGWRCACTSSTCHTIFPLLHLFCISYFPNDVVVGMQWCTSIFSLYIFVRIDWSCLDKEEQVRHVCQI